MYVKMYFLDGALYYLKVLVRSSKLMWPEAQKRRTPFLGIFMTSPQVLTLDNKRPEMSFQKGLSDLNGC